MKIHPDASKVFLSESGSCRTQQSHDSYFYTLAKLQESLPGVHMEDVTSRQLATFCLAGDPAPATVRARKSRLMGFFSWCRWRGLCTTDPSADLKFVVSARGGGVRDHTWLSEPEVARLLRSVPQTPVGTRTRVVLMAGLFMGLRKFEIAALRWDMFSRDMSTLTLTGKGNKLARLGVPPQFRAVLADWRRETPVGCQTVLPWMKWDDFTGEYMSLWSKPVGEKTVNRIVLDAGENIAIHLEPHDLRRTFAGLLEAKGMPLTDISRLMRHDNIATTSRYLEKNPARNVALADVFALEL